MRSATSTTLQPTVALREEARQAAETALTLQPNLGEAVLAMGYYHYACLKDYDTAEHSFEQCGISSCPIAPDSSTAALSHTRQGTRAPRRNGL